MKAEQLGIHLNLYVDHQKIDLVEIQSLDVREVVKYKVIEAFKLIKKPALVEDTSLTFHAMGKLPGPLIKWFLKELGIDGLCNLLNTYTDRKATAKVVFGYFDGKEVQIFESEIKGEIALQPRGTKGFGWDPIFVPNGWDKTWGEMNAEELMQTSMRRKALKELETYLSSKVSS